MRFLFIHRDCLGNTFSLLALACNIRLFFDLLNFQHRFSCFFSFALFLILKNYFTFWVIWMWFFSFVLKNIKRRKQNAASFCLICLHASREFDLDVPSNSVVLIHFWGWSMKSEIWFESSSALDSPNEFVKHLLLVVTVWAVQRNVCVCFKHEISFINYKTTPKYLFGFSGCETCDLSNVKYAASIERRKKSFVSGNTTTNG